MTGNPEMWADRQRGGEAEATTAEMSSLALSTAFLQRKRRRKGATSVLEPHRLQV